MNEKYNELAKSIIKYQENNSAPDTSVALKLNMTVERVHGIKNMKVTPTNEEVQMIRKLTTY